MVFDKAEDVVRDHGSQSEDVVRDHGGQAEDLMGDHGGQAGGQLDASSRSDGGIGEGGHLDSNLGTGGRLPGIDDGTEAEHGLTGRDPGDAGDTTDDDIAAAGGRID